MRQMHSSQDFKKFKRNQLNWKESTVKERKKKHNLGLNKMQSTIGKGKNTRERRQYVNKRKVQRRLLRRQKKLKRFKIVVKGRHQNSTHFGQQQKPRLRKLRTKLKKSRAIWNKDWKLQGKSLIVIDLRELNNLQPRSKELKYKFGQSQRNKNQIFPLHHNGEMARCHHLLLQEFPLNNLDQQKSLGGLGKFLRCLFQLHLKHRQKYKQKKLMNQL